MSIWADGLPALDSHAHLAPDVTQEQLAALGNDQIVAVTRSLAEAAFVARRSDANVTWACGIHPGVGDALEEFSLGDFEALLSSFAIIGEVGLDGKRGHHERQAHVLGQILRAVQDEPVLVSIHSTSAVGDILDLLERYRRDGFILHWFLGSAADLQRAIRLGCYFSVNAAMSGDTLGLLPRERVLTETDFPYTHRRGGGARPGDTGRVERLLSAAWSEPAGHVRRRVYRNLRDVSTATGAIERLPERLAEMLLAV